MNQHHIEVNVSRTTFAENIAYLRKWITPSTLCVVMKANAYGHGLRSLAPIAANSGADYIGICTNPEATIVRDLGINTPLMRLRMALPEELEESCDRLQIEEQIGSMEVANYLSAAGIKRGRKIPIHVNIDTGMGRSGFFPSQIDLIRKVCALPGLRIAGIMTHFASADGRDLAFTEKQLERFYSLRSALNDDLPDDVLTHTQQRCHYPIGPSMQQPGESWSGLLRCANLTGVCQSA